MFGSDVLEVVIGLLFIYLLLSLLATTINEIITTTVSQARGKILQKAIRTMLSDQFEPKKDLDDQPKPDGGDPAPAKQVQDEDLGVRFYEHPMIYRFAKKGKRGLPSYLTKRNFSLVLVDLLGDKSTPERTLESIKATVEKMRPGGTRTIMMTLIEDAQGDINRFKHLLERWFDEMMDRASGWYKRHVQKVLVGIGFVLSMLFNADTFQIARTLAADPEKRMQLVGMVEDYMEKTARPDTAQGHIDSLANRTLVARLCREATSDSAYWCRMDSLHNQVDYLVKDELKQAVGVLGLGWKQPPYEYSKKECYLAYAMKCLDWYREQLSLSQFFGWIITAFAISLGAPFWFDMLNKVMKIRGAGGKPEDIAKPTKKPEPVG